jgi:hypothetical protein
MPERGNADEDFGLFGERFVSSDDRLNRRVDLRNGALNLAQAQSGLLSEQWVCCGCKPSLGSRSILDQSLPSGCHPFEIVKRFVFGFVSLQLQKRPHLGQHCRIHCLAGDACIAEKERGPFWPVCRFLRRSGAPGAD